LYTIYQKHLELLKIGEIYKQEYFKDIHETEIAHRLVRVIGFDKYQVFYESKSYDNKWFFSGNFRRKIYFYRMATKRFSSEMELFDFLELTEQEQEYFRPDLPMRFGRTKSVSWESVTTEKINALPKEFLNEKIDLNKFVLVPFGPKGGIKKSLLIEGNENLTFLEIIKSASSIQNPVDGIMDKGIGFHRLGCEKGFPSYYIGEYLDKAGTLEE